MAASSASTAGSLERSERIFQLLVDNQDESLFGLDREGRILTWNQAAQRLTGYTEKEAVGQHLAFLLAGEGEREAEEKRLLRNASEEDRVRVELEAVRKDGHRFPAEVTLTSLAEEGEEPLGFMGVVQDLGVEPDPGGAKETPEMRMSYLARASAELASSLDYERTLQTIARLAVPEMADWAAVDIVADDGTLRRLAVHHQDPAKIELVRSLEERYPAKPDATTGAPHVVRTGQSEMVVEIPDSLLQEGAVDDEHFALLRQLGLRSYIAAPLIAHDHVLGVITFVQAESGRTYTDADRELVEDLARRAGLAVYNAQIVRQLEESSQRLEEQASELEEQASDLKGKDEELRRVVQRLRLHVDQTPLGVIEWDTEFHIVAWNPAAERIFGYTAEEAIGRNVCFIVPEAYRRQMDVMLRQLLAKQGGERITNQNVTKDGRTIYGEWYNTALVDADGKVIGAASLVEDITERKEVEAQAGRQYEQLNALRTVDLAITASLDLRVTLTVLLDQVVTQLTVDAAAILLLNPFTNRLEYADGRGFRTTAMQKTELLLGECSAGRAALDRRTVAVPNLRASTQFTRAGLLQGEEFVTHYSTPLIAKGKVVGVLEVFNRAPMHPESDWLGFLGALAGQAAIAVESAKLLEDLQKSNLELVLAYDTTLEGWAHVLDLRDSVTEGHTRRVTEMTVRLARALGIEDTALLNLRRGALLHDIGKMGIPDHILQKPGPLTDEEWEIMRKHPVHAFEMLGSIDFLRPALDIPYAHHEHWDGSGYPRGLKAEQIPFPARIFAVVDVWDALRSDRPYHESWPAEKVRQHIRDLAGTQLDPEVVDVFLSMDW